MSSIHDVANRAGVSISTVSRVLNDSPRVTDATRRSVKRAIVELGYRPNPSARALRSSRTNLIALTIPELTNPYFSAIAEGVQHVLARANFQLILCASGPDEKVEPEYLEMLANKQVDGLIIASRIMVPPEENHKTLLKMARKGYPMVTLGLRIDTRELYCDAITTDTSLGTREAMLHLIENGHTRIAYFGAPKRIASRRLEIYRSTMSERGMFVPEDIILEADPTLENGFKLAQKVLDSRDRPTAILAVNDMVAVGAMIALQEHGVSIPHEMSIVGFDDIPLASIIRPTLTTVAQPKYELGRLAAERLVGRLDGTITRFQSISLSSHLVIRDSTARVSSKHEHREPTG